MQAKCQFIDKATRIECENWYDFDHEQTFCPEHRQVKEVVHIPRTVKVISSEEIKSYNEQVASFLQMPIPEIADHIRNIEERLKSLERERRAANFAKRTLEENLSETERESVRAESQAYTPREPKPRISKKSPEERAKNRKEGFSAWAARLGCKVEDLMMMDEDEMSSKIAKFKAGQK